MLYLQNLKVTWTEITEQFNVQVWPVTLILFITWCFQNLYSCSNHCNKVNKILWPGALVFLLNVSLADARPQGARITDALASTVTPPATFQSGLSLMYLESNWSHKTAYFVRRREIDFTMKKVNHTKWASSTVSIRVLQNWSNFFGNINKIHLQNEFPLSEQQQLH